jgi:hypothetical protein
MHLESKDVCLKDMFIRRLNTREKKGAEFQCKVFDVTGLRTSGMSIATEELFSGDMFLSLIMLKLKHGLEHVLFESLPNNFTAK